MGVSAMAAAENEWEPIIYLAKLKHQTYRGECQPEISDNNMKSRAHLMQFHRVLVVEILGASESKGSIL